MKDFVFPSCPYCRKMRVALCIAAIFVLVVYTSILLRMNKPSEPT